MARWYEQERPCPHGDTSGLCDRGGCDEGHLDAYYGYGEE